MAAILAAFLMAEGMAYWWMHPTGHLDGVQVLHFQMPTDPTWKEKPEIYENVRDGLKCSGGSTGDFIDPTGAIVHLAYIEWNPDGKGAPIEAFNHLPESCMGSIGLKLETFDKERLYSLSNGNKLVFDATVFRKPFSFEKIYVFKGIWVEGLEGADLRAGAFGGNHKDLPTYRIQAAKHRFSPDYSRVVMGAIEGTSSSEDAWMLFQNKVLLRLSLQEMAR